MLIGLEKYRILYSLLHVTERNLEIKEEFLTSLKKFFSTSSLVLFSLDAVSSRNFFEPSDRVEPGTIVFTVTFVPFVSLARPLEKHVD